MNVKKVLQFSLGPIGSAVIGLITIPIMAWFISSESIGRLSLIQTLTSLCILTFSLGLDQAFVREYHESTDKNSLFKSVLMPGIILFFILFFLSFFLYESIGLYLVGDSSLQIYLLIGITVLAAIFNRFLSLILRMEERGIAYSLSQLMPKVVFLSLFIIVIIFFEQREFGALFVIHVVSLGCISLILFWNIRKNIPLILNSQLDSKKIKEYLKFGFPLVFGGIAFWGLTGMDKILLSKLSSLNELGLYAITVNFAAVGLILQSIFSTIWAPVLYKWVAKGVDIDKIENVTDIMLFIVVFIFSLSGLFSWLVSYLLPGSYSQVQYLFILCLAFPLFYTLSETTVVGIGVTKKTIFAMLISIVIAIINFIGNYLLIPTHGALGAAISTAISFWLFFILRTETSYRLWVTMPRFKIYVFSFICLMLAIVEGLFGKTFIFELKFAWFLLFVLNVFFARSKIKKYWGLWKQSRKVSSVK